MGRPIVNLTGQRFGMLVAVKVVGRTHKDKAIWLCRCDCGRTVKRTNGNLTSNKRNNTRASCGCGPTGRKSTHGMTHSREYKSWISMRARCNRPTHHKYHLYGALGVKVCKRWQHDFQAFYGHVGPRPDGCTLDRWPNPCGNYKPGNVRWANATQQRHNRRD